jgi:hypothetical protein
MLLGAVLEALAELGVVADVDADGLLTADLWSDPVLVGGDVAGVDLKAGIHGRAVGLSGGALVLRPCLERADGDGVGACGGAAVPLVPARVHLLGPAHPVVLPLGDPLLPGWTSPRFRPDR